MPRVLNSRLHGNPEGSVYVGRPSKWGNPFSHLPGVAKTTRVRSRDEAVSRYREYILGKPELIADLHELRGKNLVCWCNPLPCHADILLELANQPEFVDPLSRSDGEEGELTVTTEKLNDR